MVLAHIAACNALKIYGNYPTLDSHTNTQFLARLPTCQDGFQNRDKVYYKAIFFGDFVISIKDSTLFITKLVTLDTSKIYSISEISRCWLLIIQLSIFEQLTSHINI